MKKKSPIRILIVPIRIDIVHIEHSSCSSALPHHVIFTLQYPLYNPTMFKTQVDGEGVCCYAIAELKRETAIESMLPLKQPSATLAQNLLRTIFAKNACQNLICLNSNQVSLLLPLFYER